MTDIKLKKETLIQNRPGYFPHTTTVMKNIYFIYISAAWKYKNNAWAWNLCWYRVESRTEWSCDGGWSEAGTASCVEDLREYRPEAAAWSQGGGQSREGGELTGDRTCSRPLFNALRHSLVFPSAPHTRPDKPRLPVNQQMDPSFKRTLWQILSAPDRSQREALKGNRRLSESVHHQQNLDRSMKCHRWAPTVQDCSSYRRLLGILEINNWLWSYWTVSWLKPVFWH